MEMLGFEVKCPYTKIELMLAGIELDTKFGNTEQGITLLENIHTIFNGDGEETLMAQVAKMNGLTPKELADSPNRTEIVTEGFNVIFNHKKDKLVNNLGLSDKEAWCVTAMIINPLFFDQVRDPV